MLVFATKKADGFAFRCILSLPPPAFGECSGTALGGTSSTLEVGRRAGREANPVGILSRLQDAGREDDPRTGRFSF